MSADLSAQGIALSDRPCAKAENYQNCNNPSRIALTVARLKMAVSCGFAPDQTASCSADLGANYLESDTLSCLGGLVKAPYPAIETPTVKSTSDM